MSTELQQAQQFSNPATGEVLTLASPTEDLGRYLADVRELEATIREYKNAVQAELLTRMDRDRSWTVHSRGLKLRAPSDEPGEEFDAASLREGLEKCVDRGELTIEAVDRAVEVVVTYEVHKAGLNALKKNPHFAELIARHRRPVDKKRYVSVERSPTS